MTDPPEVMPADTDAVAHVFVDELADRYDISGADGHHLQRVRRLVAGESVTAADGSGAWRLYEVIDVARGRVTLDARTVVQHEPSAAASVALAIALTKGGIDALVASVTELGVTRITPVRAARTVVRWDERKAAHAIERMRALAREAAMQSRRTRVPAIDDVTDIDALRDRPHLVVADRTGGPANELVPPERGEWTLLVGPEGGLAVGEQEALANRRRVALGTYVLRAGTAPVAGAAILGDRIAQMRRA